MNTVELADWVLPFWREQQLSAAVGDDDMARSWTTLGNLASDRKAIVDQRGLVSPCSAGWSLDWWVGADDRWHFPSRDAGVRQRLVGDTPVVETAMRVPGGDAVHRAYAARAPSGFGVDELVVIEIHNRTSLPFAIAFAVRPYNPAGLSDIRQIEICGGSVAVNGRVGVWLPCPPRRVAGSNFDHGDSARVVQRGQAGDAMPQPAQCRRGMAQAAFLYPLAHTAVMRIAIPIDRPRRGLQPATLPELPSSEAVVRGWQAQTRRGMRLELPVGRLASAVAANRRYLLLMPPGGDEASRVVALDRHGFHLEADEALGALAAGRIDGDANMTFLWALAQHWRLTGDGDIVQRLAPVVRTCARRIPRGSWSSLRGLLEGADLLAPAGDRLAADGRALARLRSLLDLATPTWTWGEGHDRGVAAEFCSLVRNLLVREVPGGLALLTLVPDEWLGLPIEVHDAPTHAGLLSYVIRWHGERPALLWELRRREGVDPVRLTIPGLDGRWSSLEPVGETLLGGLS